MLTFDFSMYNIWGAFHVNAVVLYVKAKIVSLRNHRISSFLIITLFITPLEETLQLKI